MPLTVFQPVGSEEERTSGPSHLHTIVCWEPLCSDLHGDVSLTHTIHLNGIAEPPPPSATSQGFDVAFKPSRHPSPRAHSWDAVKPWMYERILRPRPSARPQTPAEPHWKCLNQSRFAQ